MVLMDETGNHGGALNENGPVKSPRKKPVVIWKVFSRDLRDPKMLEVLDLWDICQGQQQAECGTSSRE